MVFDSHATEGRPWAVSIRTVAEALDCGLITLRVGATSSSGGISMLFVKQPGSPLTERVRRKRPRRATSR